MPSSTTLKLPLSQTITPALLMLVAVGCLNSAFTVFRPDAVHLADALQNLDGAVRDVILSLGVVPALSIPAGLVMSYQKIEYPIVKMLLPILEAFGVISQLFTHTPAALNYITDLTSNGGTLTMYQTPDDLLGYFGSIELSVTVYSIVGLSSIYMLVSYALAAVQDNPCCKVEVEVV